MYDPGRLRKGRYFFSYCNLFGFRGELYDPIILQRRIKSPGRFLRRYAGIDNASRDYFFNACLTLIYGNSSCVCLYIFGTLPP